MRTEDTRVRGKALGRKAVNEGSCWCRRTSKGKTIRRIEMRVKSRNRRKSGE